jgi:serine-type D-Ala-D-Ala carboxypeptidase/endopeptidase
MRTHLLCLAVALSSVPSFAMSDEELGAALERRFKDDRTGACVAAAVIYKGTSASAYVCAKSQRPYDKHTAFEIGSNSKPMTAALLAELIARGEVTLDDPIASCCPREPACHLSTAARSPSATSSPTRPACPRSRGA